MSSSGLAARLLTRLRVASLRAMPVERTVSYQRARKQAQQPQGQPSAQANAQAALPDIAIECGLWEAVVKPRPALAELTATVKPWFDQRFANVKENEILTRTRDYLLPKLLSGEVQGKEAKKRAEVT